MLFSVYYSSNSTAISMMRHRHRHDGYHVRSPPQRRRLLHVHAAVGAVVAMAIFLLLAVLPLLLGPLSFSSSSSSSSSTTLGRLLLWNATSLLVNDTSMPAIHQIRLRYNNNNAPAPVHHQLAVFYNVYIPPHAHDLELQTVLDKIQAQVQQIGALHVANNNNNRQTDDDHNGRRHYNRTTMTTMVLYYVTIGRPNTVTPDWMQSILEAARFPGLSSHWLGHYHAGFETITLSAVYNYCVQQQPHDANHYDNMMDVAYVHNKGSFHPGRGQDNWRVAGTQAALSRDCLRPPSSSSSHNNAACNACALLWNTLPFVMSPGNFWSARCDYVRQLVPPNMLANITASWYEQRIAPLRQHGYLRHYYSATHTGRDPSQPPQLSFWTYGTGRFADEMWIGSHPALVPCDLSASTANIDDWRLQWTTTTEHHDTAAPSGKFSPAAFQLALAPRHNISEHFIRAFRQRLPLLDHFANRSRDFNLLPGQISRHAYFYNQTAADSSWIWQHYPDGHLWRDVLRQVGPGRVHAAFAARYLVDR